MLTIRRWHSYLGLLIAPSVLFFSLTGAVQLFGLHEARGSYTPPALIEKLSSVHKDQVYAAGHHGGPPPSPPGSGAPTASDAFAAAPGRDAMLHGGEAHHDDEDSSALPTVLLKWYFLIVAVALTFSTGFGVWMGLTQIRRRGVAWGLLIAGTFVPLALLLL